MHVRPRDVANGLSLTVARLAPLLWQVAIVPVVGRSASDHQSGGQRRGLIAVGPPADSVRPARRRINRSVVSSTPDCGYWTICTNYEYTRPTLAVDQRSCWVLCAVDMVTLTDCRLSENCQYLLTARLDAACALLISWSALMVL